jgi:hypothetical protein
MSGHYGRTPSVKAMARYFDKDTAQKAKDLMDCRIDPEEYESVQAWVRQCYNRPSKREQRMLALNEVLQGFGVEIIGNVNMCDDDDIHAEYVNMGETYNVTILFDRRTRRFRLTTWGDWVETFEQKHGRIE